MRILVVNDDGFEAEGLACLAKATLPHGEVTVVAPSWQCSAMSHRLILRKAMGLRRLPFPVQGVKDAYSLEGTPADCVKVALHVLMDPWPDVVLSGVNFGYNCGFDIAYSATVAAAIEARMKGIPAIAISQEALPCQEVRDAYLPGLLAELLHKDAGPGQIWNVNFPGCSLSDCRGIAYGQQVLQDYVFADAYHVERQTEDSLLVTECGEMEEGEVPEGTDLYAVRNGFVSVGTVRGTVFS